MPSLYLGKIRGKQRAYEIHVLTDGLPFREYCVSAIGDISLFHQLLHARYDVLEAGRPIHCTAVSPDTERKIESNPHDFREGTVHIVSIDGGGDIECALSIAVDTGEKDNGDLIGVPLENQWLPGDYPPGPSLAAFRKKYVRLNWGQDRAVAPWEMAELYRHFRKQPQDPSRVRELAPRLGLYAACYHLLVREANTNGKTATWLMLFDAIPHHFNLYRLATAAVLRDMTIETPPRWVSPERQLIEMHDQGGIQAAWYRNEMISRVLKVPMPYRENQALRFRLVDMAFLDGLTDTFSTTTLENMVALPGF